MVHSLKIKKQGNTQIITLDNFDLKAVTEYEIKSSANKQAELTIKMMVEINEVGLK